MPENVGTMALKLSVDSQGWSNGLRSASDEQTKFAGRTKAANDEMKAGSQGASEKITGFFDKVKSGGTGAVFSELKAGLGDVVGQLGAGVGAAASFAGAIGAGLSLVVDKAREASKEVNAIAKFGERIGANAQEAQVIRRTFELAGVADAEHTINRLAQHLGDLRTDPTGGVSQALERIHLDPQRVSGLPTRQAIEEIVVSLGQVPNVFDRANISQQLFGKSFQEVQELVRRGRSAFTQAEREVSAFGHDAETVSMAREAEKEWKKFGETIGSITGKISEGFTTAFVTLSLEIARALNTLTDFITKLDEIPPWAKGLIVGGIAGGIPGAAIGAGVGWALGNSGGPPAVDLNAGDRTSSGGGGDWGDAVERIRTVQDELNRILERGLRITPVSDIGVQVGRAIRGLEQQIVLTSTLRQESERLGYVRAGATQQEVDRVRTLIEQRQKLRANGATPDLLADFDRGAQAQILATATSAGQNLVSNLREEVRLLGLSKDEAFLQHQIQQGVTAEYAQQALLLERQRVRRTEINALVDQLTVSSRSTLDSFARQAQFISEAQESGRVSVAQATRLFGQIGRDFTAQMGGPSSFAVNAPAVNSVELANMVADLEIRQRHGVDDPAQRIPQLLQVMIEGDAETRRILDSTGEAIRNVLRQLPQVPANL